ncbi:unnamed protein product [Miscanthus lutarioriparius]|uniref:GPI ethanolamine phosphate transferase 3 n=1 Tax=Miscanthus lutarioriparius TaxID=422564 RepID=A0A811PHA8_9POAL|nr:unnamed protein product [Miscanthus lutarioriparius]
MSPPASHRRHSRLLNWPLLFVAILAVHSLAVYLFTRGFLLTRTELDLHSSRDDLSPQGDVSPGCASWPPAAVDRLVIVVLDAVRFDFVAPSTFFSEKQPWMDKLQVLQKLAADEKTSARIFKALADPPTTSLQRLEVDNGVIEHLLPSLHKNDWDVLIAHFFGVDHAEHIFGVDSTPMIQKLEQYNQILEGVIETLRSLSKPGGTHENTLLLVMGDHGQTLNGDHGGGTAEEVETSLFAWSPRTPPDAVLSVLDDSSCNVDLHGKEVCVSTMQQLDFAVTISALLGIPFPFGSIGRVNPELYALSTVTWVNQRMGTNACTSQDDLEAWMGRYAEVLCVNCWQVKRYIDQYSATSVIGFPLEDLQHITDLYSRAQENWSASLITSSSETGSQEKVEGKGSVLLQQIDAYNDFLQSFAKLARSAWTELDLWSMGVGLLLMILSVIIQASTLNLVFLLLNIFTRFGIEVGMSKQLPAPTITKDHPVSVFCKILGVNSCNILLELFPIISLAFVAYIMLKCLSRAICQRFLKYFLLCGTMVSYLSIAFHWASETTLFSHAGTVQEFGRSLAPRIVYAIGGLSLAISAFSWIFGPTVHLKMNKRIIILSAVMLCSWSPTILILLGRQGLFVALICMTGAWCIVKLQQKHQRESELSVADPVSVIQWSLLAVCLFYLTGHWCTFDGLRYGAAFIGFDHFHIIRQGFLLSIDTFCVSHILPILSLPFIAIVWYNTTSKDNELKDVILNNINKVLLMYVLITAITATLTIICVAIQRRHLMVWGLFAPKYVFNAIGLLLTDLLICLASIYYS